MDFRIGIGYDVHRLVPERKLILGGVEIAYDLGLLGHSDADVLTHAIMDAMLGALALGDIGKLFPDNDNSYKGISSMLLLKKVDELLKEKGYLVNNIDTIIIAQKPKLAPYMDNIRKSLADCLNLDLDRVSVKATTEEGLGFTGDGSGIAAKASVLIYKN